MENRNRTSDERNAYAEELKRVKEELRRVKQTNRFMAIRLQTQDRRKAELATKMGRITATAQKVGRVRIIDVNTVEDGDMMQYLGLVQCATLCGTTYVTMVKRLQKEGVIVREKNVWVVGSDYQQSGLFVYLSGVRNDYTRFYLKVAPAGVPFIRQMLGSRSRKTHFAKHNTSE